MWVGVSSNKFAQNSIYLSSQQATRYFGKLPLRVVMRFVFFRSKLRGIRPLAIEIYELCLEEVVFILNNTSVFH
ncbi:hypothetical protein PsalMR5_03388 [Piscirickettsia salmonis]|uniref:hypothetical protein n=1 Tax=Piscirickettsia salmonis TaxID=1238 RepID=UPI0012BB1973|nr:hypothetical protein [Piscirickettsia salmonis]QGP55913.1 hypothetical protein PsalSR1_03383 [Piscirickettsia salmonis]QGP58215.1 hypothetical protein PsalBI1_00769 [Piscirickettsia salmonis]QGP65482.1 hypothetical protein PsalMR5_03388 [Piscirickettsia salmonis]